MERKQISAYVIEKNKNIGKYTLSFDEAEINSFINTIDDLKLEEQHSHLAYQMQILNHMILNEMVEHSNITSSEILIDYLRGIINSKFLNLEEINKLFNDYNNPMYSPATMQVLKKFFNLMQIERRKAIPIYYLENLYQKWTIYCKQNQLSKKIIASKQNTIALNKLGINLYSKANNKTYQKTIK